jgi:glycosyltransferase involved in cell wall biosynthesis
MKIALCSSFVPFVNGGYRNIVEWLAVVLRDNGHHVEIFYLPQADTPDVLFQQMIAYRWVNLDTADTIICFRPQAHVIPHHRKIIWFIHHLRVFYDLWPTEYRGFPDDANYRGIRDALRKVDDTALREAKKIFTNSQIVRDRLRTYNNVESEVLYPPILNPERFYCSGFNDEIVCISRVEHHKRQHLLVQAMQYTHTPVRLRLSGVSADSGYPDKLRKMIGDFGLVDRVILDQRWITEDEKAQQLANCLACAYMPLDEDSYGYPALEASHASKAILTTSDSGGVLELVQDRVNGYVTEPSPQAVAEAMDRLYLEPKLASAFGRNAHDRVSQLNISWSHVVQRLLA